METPSSRQRASLPLRVETGRARTLTLPRCLALLAMVGSGTVQLVSAQSAPLEPWTLELEVQTARIKTNQVQVPNDSQGTRFDATEFTGDRSHGARLTAFVPLDWWKPNDALRVVLAPLNLSGTAVPTSAIGFDGAVFQPGAPLSVKYKFNTYRMTYLVPIFTDALQQGWDFRLGATLAVRDAQIKLSQGNLVQDFSNVGPIPLVYISATKTLGGGWKALGEFDAFPAPGGGGLFDGSLKLGYQASGGIELNAGVRYQVGAAKDKEIFNSLSEWALVLGLRASF